ncbi:MAG TPA: MMPL family transporter, partial [Verrucomicrobiae bacterium]
SPVSRLAKLWKRGWWLPLVALLIFGLWRVRLDVEIFNLLPDNLPVVHGLRLYQKHFAGTRELIITVRAPSAEAAETAARQLAERLSPQTNAVSSVVWQPPWLEHPEQMVELIAHLWLNQPPEAFAELTNRLAPEKLDALLADARERLATALSPTDIGRLSYDPFGFTQLPAAGLGGSAMSNTSQEGFTSADGTFRVVFVEARDDLKDYRACAAWLADVRATVDSCRQATTWPDKVAVGYTGAPAFTTEVSTGMERDLKGSVLATLGLILVLFWGAHRSLRPLFWLMTMLALVVAGTLASGGLIFGKLNAVSLGFAAVLMGLAVDYGLVLYQESVAAPHMSAGELRRLLASSIIWSAATTAAAFGLLNFGGLPGLAQLGSLVGIGVLLAALVMLFLFLPLILRRKPSPAAAPEARAEQAHPGRVHARPVPILGNGGLCRAVTVLIVIGGAGILWFAWPGVDHTNSPLQPKHSGAQVALDEMQAELNQRGDPLLVIVSGRDELEVARRLDACEARFAGAVTNGLLRSYLLPSTLWPHAERQRLNLAMAMGLAARVDTMKAAAARAGFTDEALALTTDLLRTWTFQAGATQTLWPTNQSCRWLLKRAVAWTGRDWLAAGALYPPAGKLTAAGIAELDPAIPGVWLTGWAQLGETLLQSVKHRLWGVFGGTVVIVGVCLWLTFRRRLEVLLSFAALAFSLLGLFAVMGLAGWKWNLMNLMALPLLMGAGVDYTIHVQLALRRHGGDAATMRRITGKAVFLCAATTVAGFGSNALSGNAGLASLGLVCSAGVAITYLSSVYLLPSWWVLVAPRLEVPGSTSPPKSGPPSSFYRAGLWRVGLAFVRLLPAWVVNGFCVLVAEFHFRLHRERREVVVRNLLPACSGDRSAAERTAHRLYRRFAVKLADLWRVEAGAPVRNWIVDRAELEIIRNASQRGRGLLFIVLHLGNWEHGGLLLADWGIRLTVVTLAEPDDRLTEIRTASRARWGIETLIIGRDSFALVEMVKRLESGASLAIAIDRPSQRGDVQVDFFGRPFAAPSLAADLARASGCALVGVMIVRHRDGFEVKVLPEFAYDRRALGNREARRELTQQILRAFEPQIRDHLDQWYQFVPIWPEDR